ncbi:unnamed protein product [Amoebophrya sp. A25]|nr:unnamed protein product [Amoebophrya sp. A25]|eukprot:GSA25T00027888001.1
MSSELRLLEPWPLPVACQKSLNLNLNHLDDIAFSYSVDKRPLLALEKTSSHYLQEHCQLSTP